MKGNRKGNGSRRDFIRIAGQAALGSTLVGCTATGVRLSAPKAADASKLRNPYAHQTQCRFKGKIKPPGWLPDKTAVDSNYLFPEEAILQDSQGITPFAPPFEEPSPNDPPDKWNKFKDWVLGSPFTKKPGDEFDDLLEKIANCARRYNAALYWMRRLHLYEKSRFTHLPLKPPPPRNPHGDHDEGLSDDPTKSPPPYLMIKEAQENWKTAVNDLNDALNYTSPGISRVYADMIQVNGYIVSMRVVDPARMAPGGSSSSHISLSSAFSSS